MKTLSVIRAAAAAFALAAGCAHATYIPFWDVTDTATFVPASVTPSCADPSCPTLLSPTSLRWGEAATGAGRSGLDIVNAPLMTVGLGDVTPTTWITHLNFPIYPTSLTSVDILATLLLNPASTPLALVLAKSPFTSSSSRPPTFPELAFCAQTVMHKESARIPLTVVPTFL